jgi:hypothetical protein
MGQVCLHTGPPRLYVFGHTQKNLDDQRVKLCPGAATQFCLGCRDRDWLFVWPARYHGVIGVYHAQNARRQRDLFAHQPAWIALPIPTFVMRYNDLGQQLEVSINLPQDASTQHGMLVHKRPLFFVQRAGLVQNGIRDTNLANIMQ